MAESFLPLQVRRKTPHSSISLVNQPRRVLLKQITKHDLFDPISHVSFSPLSPYDLAVSHGFSVSLFNSNGGGLIRSLNRFRDRSSSPSFKPDGKLLTAGCADGNAFVFNVETKTALRTFKGHKGAVRTSLFSRDGLRVLTGSEDKTVRAWDLGTARCIFSLNDAQDYVQCQNLSPASSHVWITGSADQKVRVYDLRQQKAIFTLEHGSPIDDVHILPGGGLGVSIGGPDIRIWDFFSGGQVLSNISCHAKAVTSGAVYGSNSMLATGGLDGHLKIHDLRSFEMVGSIPFHSQILSVDVTADGNRFALGMADGTVSVQARSEIANKAKAMATKPRLRTREFEGYGRGFEKIDDEPPKPTPGSRRYFERGRYAKPEPEKNLVVKTPSRPKLEEYDRKLQKFKFGEALDAAIATKSPLVLTSIVEELMIRGSLRGALSGRDLRELCPMLEIVRRNIRRPRFTDRLVHLVNVVIDMYAEKLGECKEADNMMKAILQHVENEQKLRDDLLIVQGIAESLLNISEASKV